MSFEGAIALIPEVTTISCSYSCRRARALKTEQQLTALQIMSILADITEARRLALLAYKAKLAREKTEKN